MRPSRGGASDAPKKAREGARAAIARQNSEASGEVKPSINPLNPRQPCEVAPD